MTEISVSAENQIRAMAVELTRLQKENINLRAAIIKLEEDYIDEIKVGGTD